MADLSLRLVTQRMGYAGRALPHGFRSTFRDWRGDVSAFDRTVTEAALGHATGDSTETAYRRSSAIEKCRALMSEWNAYCDQIKRRPLVLPG